MEVDGMVDKCKMERERAGYTARLQFTMGPEDSAEMIM